MSRYTTQVKTICEEKYLYPAPETPTTDEEILMFPNIYVIGNYWKLKRSPGAKAIPYILNNVWNKIFDEHPGIDLYNPGHYPELCKKILLHYYMREICCETVGLWELWMQTRMREILPYYNKLYESIDFKFNPLYDVNVTKEHTRSETGNTTSHGSKNTTEDTTLRNTEDEVGRTLTNNHTTESNAGNQRGTSHENSTDTTNKTTDSNKTTDAEYNQDTMDRYADTPQGKVTSPIFDKYLTNARNIDQTGSSTTTEVGNVEENGTDELERSGETTSTLQEDKEKTENGQEDRTNNKTGNKIGHNVGLLSSELFNENLFNQTFNETIVGKHSGASYSKMIEEYRKILINVDLKAINEFKDLFFLLW